MTLSSRRGWVVALVICCAACGGLDTLPAPTAPVTSSVAAAPASPAPSGSTRVFADPQPPTPVYVLSDWTRESSFTLYGNGSFTLQSAADSSTTHGTYKENTGVIAFTWDVVSVAGPWTATGVLDGDRLIIRYNDLMLFDDFENAVYVRRQDAPARR
jgi:hypothetical protein